MRILLDLQACQSGSRLGGIGRYSLALAKGIVAAAGRHDVYVMLNGMLPLHECELRLDFAGLLDPDRFVSFHGCPPVSAHIAEHHVGKHVSELLREDFLRRLAPDVIHVASLVEGWGDDVVTSLGPPDLCTRTSVTWYDLIPYAQPEMYLRDAAVAAHYHSKIDEVKKAAQLLAISQFSCDEAVELLGFPRDQVINIRAGVDSRFHPKRIPDAEVNDLRNLLGIRKPFLMYAGSFDVRKNQPALIQAFAKLPAELRDQYQLVIAGNGWPGIYDQLRGVARRSGLDKDSVIFTGRVDDDQLLALYNLCHLFVFPSLCEGFGLPALEAMACGAATIGSDCTSIPEVIGRADALFDPTSIDSIAHKLCQVLSDASFRRELSRHGLERAKLFTWENAAGKALEGFEELHARRMHAPGTRSVVRRISHRAGRADSGILPVVSEIAQVLAPRPDHDHLLPAIAQALERNERANETVSRRAARVGWVTTWGTRCGIASYSRYLIEAAAEKPAIVLGARSPVVSGESRSGVRVESCWTLEHDDLRDLRRAVRRHRLNVLYIQFNYGFFDFAALSQFVAEHVAAGVRIFITLHSTQDPPPSISPKRLSSLQVALNQCERVLVHSMHDVARLKEIGVAHNVALIAHGTLEPPHASRVARQQNETFTIGTYGFFLKHKGLIEIIRAFGEMVCDDPHLRLRMLNAEYSADASGEMIARAREEIANRGIDAQVELCTDYLSDEHTLARLSEADLIVYPYQQTGESSSAAVRMGLATGRLVVTTPLPIFDDVRDIVCRLPGTTPEELKRGLVDLIARMRAGDDPELLAIRGRCEEWRRRNAISNIANTLYALSGCGATWRSRAA